MGKVNIEDVAGLYIDQEMVCWECCSNDERTTFSEDDIIAEDATQNDESIYFCDRCKKRI